MPLPTFIRTMILISRKRSHLNTMVNVNVKSLPTLFITLSIVESNEFILPNTTQLIDVLADGKSISDFFERVHIVLWTEATIEEITTPN